MLSHAASWAAYAAMLAGRWDATLELGDILLDMREQFPRGVRRFTFPGWVGAMRVAAARMDTTRMARYRSAFVAIADLSQAPVSTRPPWQMLIDGDMAVARGYLAQEFGARDRKAEI